MRHKALLAVVAASILAVCCGCGLLGDFPCCCVPSSGSPYWTTTNGCGGSSIGCITGDPARNVCPTPDPPGASDFSGPDSTAELQVLKELESESVSRPATSSESSKPKFDAFSTSANHPAASCLQQCPPGQIENTSCSQGFVEKMYEQPLSKIYAQVANQSSSTISPQDLAKMFNADASGCKRSNTAISSQSITNTGPGACRIWAYLGNTLARVDITIPKVLVANFDTRSRTIKLVFRDPKSSPSIAFYTIGKYKEEHRLNGKFGGVVRWAESDGRRLFFRTDKGCVGASY